MKRLFLLISMTLIIVIGVSAQKTYVLLTGISNYGDTTLNLSSTTKDVKTLQKVFRKLGYTVSVNTSRYATGEEIDKKLDAIISKAEPKDAIIFFFSGHGDTGGFITYGPQKYPYSLLVNKLSKARTNNIFCFIDACRSGSAMNTGTSYNWNSGNKITFFMSSRAEEYSLENQWIGHGYFSQAMQKGLRGKADSNGDRKITVMELFRYMHADVVRRSKNTKYQQHPQLIGPRSMMDYVLAKW